MLNKNQSRIAGSDLPHIIVLLAIPLLVLLPFLISSDTLLLSRSELGSDYIAKQLPNALFIKQAWQNTGHLPAWQPNIMSGIPIIGNPSFLTTYPPYWLILLFSIPWAINFLFAVHLALAGIGVYLFTRKCLGLSGLAATSSGVAFMLSPKVLAHVSGGHLDVIIALAWFPVALFAMDRALLKLSFRWSWLAGLAFGFMFVSHAPTSVLAVYILAAYGLYSLVRKRAISSNVQAKIKSVGQAGLLVFGASLGFLLSAGSRLLPLIDLLPNLKRAQLTLTDATAFALPPQILPLILAIPSVPFPEWVIYTGASVAVLCLYAGFRTKLRGKRFWLIVGVLAMVYALGTSTPLFTLAFRFLPGFNLMRVPSRTWFFVSFVLALFCGAGFQRLLSEWKRSNALPTLVLFIMLLSTLFLTRPANAWQWLALAAALLSVGSLVFLTRHSSRASRHLKTGGLLLGVVTLELAIVGWSFWQPGPRPVMPTWLDEVGDYQVGKDERLYSEGRVSHYMAVSKGLNIVEGIDAVQLSHYATFIATATDCQTEIYSGSVPAFVIQPAVDAACPERQVDSFLVGLLNVGYAFTSTPQIDPGWQLERKIKEGYVYSNTQTRPLAFLVSQTLPVASVNEAIQKLKSATPDDPLLVIGGQVLHEDASDLGSAEISWQSPESFEVQVISDTSAFLVLGITYLPGWKAFDENGQAQNVYQTQLTMMGSYVPAGHTKLTFVYTPDSLALGIQVTIVAAVLSVLGLLVEWWRKISIP